MSPDTGIPGAGATDDLFEPAGESYAPIEGPYVVVLAEFEKTTIRNNEGIEEPRLRWYFEVFEQEADSAGEGYRAHSDRHRRAVRTRRADLDQDGHRP